MRYRLVDAGRDRQVEHPDVESLAIRHRVVDSGDHVADVSVAGAVESFEHDQVGTGRDAAPAAARVHAGARNDSGHVRAVPVVVVRNGLMGDEVGPVHDPARTQIVVRRRNARVDHRDADSGAIHAEVFAQPARADERSGA